MSQSVLPALPGVKWDGSLQPEFSTAIQRAKSGKEYRAASMQFPITTFMLAYEFLREEAPLLELQTLCGFFLVHQGSFDSFLYTNPSDSLVADQNIGAGDGVTTAFQLTRTYGAGGFTQTEAVQNVNAITNVKVNGVAKTNPADYSVNSTGVVTFVAAPANGLAITWSGAYYYRCRFLRDALDFKNFGSLLWDLKQLAFIGSPRNKV